MERNQQIQWHFVCSSIIQEGICTRYCIHLPADGVGEGLGDWVGLGLGGWVGLGDWVGIGLGVGSGPQYILIAVAVILPVQFSPPNLQRGDLSPT